MCDYRMERQSSTGSLFEAKRNGIHADVKNLNANQFRFASHRNEEHLKERLDDFANSKGEGNDCNRSNGTLNEDVMMRSGTPRNSLRAENGTGVNDNFLCSSVHFANKRLCYSNQHCNRIPDVIVKLYCEKSLSLDLSFNDLVTTRGLERFVHLRELVLDNNQLNDGVCVPYLPHLHTLSLNKNLINDIESLMDKLTRSLPALNFLSLLGNKACPNQLSDMSKDEDDYARYRYYVISRLPNLDFLDYTRVSFKERQLASSKGQFMRVVRPKDEDTGDGNSRGSTQDDSPPSSYYSPLPRTMRRPDDHKGAYSKCKYKYSGKHSEGNRFISNNDL